MLTNPTFETILDQAYAAANEAIKAEVAREPENPRAFDCGFAWAKTTERTTFVNYCRRMHRSLSAQNKRREAHRYGDRDYPSGWHWWCPGEFDGQSVRIIRKGAEAFSDSLSKALNMQVFTLSRLD